MHKSNPKEYLLLFLMMIILVFIGLIFQELGYLVFFQEKDIEKVHQGLKLEDIISPNDLERGDSFFIKEEEEPRLYEYIEIINSCNVDFSESCVLVRSGPSTEHSVVSRLRNGIVLKVEKSVTNELGEKWYKITFDEWLRYPERVSSDWYVYADNVKSLQDEGIKILEESDDTNSDKHILIDRSEQKLFAYEGEKLRFEFDISSGLLATPTPRGIFKIYKKTPSRYMQGPIVGISNKYFDLPGVPWNLYFTEEGAVIHGAYWHNSFGQRYSNGCINLLPLNAKELYDWADVGVEVLVRD